MFNVSIVLFNNSISEVKKIVDTLRKNPLVQTIFLLDNSPQQNDSFESLPVEYIFNHRNLGYGAAHNIAIRQTIAQKIPYHLVVNVDIAFEAEILTKIVEFMDPNSEVGALMPKVLNPNGSLQFLCKLIPTPLDLFYRRFLPKKMTKKNQNRFELHRFGYDKTAEIPFLTGCFMFLRTQALIEVGVFDEQFHLYMEDVDLSRRIHQKYKTIFYPSIQIVHQHEQGSYKSKKLLWEHIVNSCRYFNKWGWFFDQERRKINQETIKKL